MSLPPPTWGPPQTTAWTATVRTAKPRRRVAGWCMIATGAVALVVLAVLAVTSAMAMLGDSTSVTMPGNVDIDCDRGDQWRVGPATNSSVVALGPVTVTIDGQPVPVRATDGSSTETLTVFGTTFTAVATFRCPSDGAATVSFSGPAGVEAAVFPAFGSITIFLALGAGGLLSSALLVVGIVLAVKHRPVR